MLGSLGMGAFGNGGSRFSGHGGGVRWWHVVAWLGDGMRAFSIVVVSVIDRKSVV